ncbi:hypothetical protein ILYODFUR_028331 [Ilyodon furcidens]|uniref:Uncharacterized protein n=1 Tax=Ilyodon furcidens TaxID=33524 RepID=A0ABV0UX84_9TELE
MEWKSPSRLLVCSSFPLDILGKSLSQLEKGPRGHRHRIRVLWIIDSRCLVIHRLHMPANSSGRGDDADLAPAHGPAAPSSMELIICWSTEELRMLTWLF